MDCQVVRGDDVALLREGTQVSLSSSSQEQVDHSTASLADEMIVLPGLGIESRSLFVQEEGANLALLDETVQVAINGGETDAGQLFVNPSVDLMGERVVMIALKSCEHLLQLPRSTLAGGPSHRLPRILAIGRSECGIPNRGSAVKRFPVTASDKRRRGSSNPKLFRSVASSVSRWSMAPAASASRSEGAVWSHDIDYAHVPTHDQRQFVLTSPHQEETRNVQGP